MSAPKSEPVKHPESIGRYRVVRPLSKGGMALVYEGRRDSLAGISTKVAIKVILPDYADSETFKDLFINEARLGAAMQHQNLVQIQDFDAENDQYFLVMEYVEGLTISRVVGVSARHDLRIPMGVICEIGRQVCDGLHYAHQAVDTDGRPLGLVHRDVKPSNLILNGQGVVKILDFGISKGSLRQEREGSVKGTWGYMSPEQAMGSPIGPEADIFALAIVLWEMAARRAMFKGKREEEIRRLLQDDHGVRVAATLDPHYAPLVAVLVRALQRDPRRRFADAASFGRALSELLPDLITAREEVVRFGAAVNALQGGRAVASAPVVSSRGSAQRAAIGLPGDAAHNRRLQTAATWGAGVAALAAVALLGVAWNYTQRPIEGAPARIEDRAIVVETPDVTPDAAAPPADVDPPAPPSPATVPDASPAAPVPPAPAQPERRQPPSSVDAKATAQGGGTRTTSPAKEKPVTVEKRRPRVPQATPDPAVADPAPKPAQNVGYLWVTSVQPAEIYVDGQLVPPGTGELPYKPGSRVVSILAPDGRRANFVVALSKDAHVRRDWDFERWGFR